MLLPYESRRLRSNGENMSRTSVETRAVRRVGEGSQRLGEEEEGGTVRGSLRRPEAVSSELADSRMLSARMELNSRNLYERRAMKRLRKSAGDERGQSALPGSQLERWEGGGTGDAPIEKSPSQRLASSSFLLRPRIMMHECSPVRSLVVWRMYSGT